MRANLGEAMKIPPLQVAVQGYYMQKRNYASTQTIEPTDDTQCCEKRRQTKTTHQNFPRNYTGPGVSTGAAQKRIKAPGVLQ